MKKEKKKKKKISISKKKNRKNKNLSKINHKYQKLSQRNWIQIHLSNKNNSRLLQKILKMVKYKLIFKPRYKSQKQIC